MTTYLGKTTKIEVGTTPTEITGVDSIGDIGITDRKSVV